MAYNDTVFHIICPLEPRVLASCSSLRSIIDLSTTSSSGASIESDEIFVLEGPRTILRIAESPDRFHCDVKDLEASGANPLGADETEGVGLETVSSTVASMSESVVGKLPSMDMIVGWGEKLKLIAREEEAVEGIDGAEEVTDEAFKFDKIGEEGFDEKVSLVMIFISYGFV